jgi:phosphoribosylamine--glycine ligase
LVDAALEARIEREVVGPVLRGMASEGHPFHGFLYCGLMLTTDGPKVIEFNVRFGDPEAQVVMPLIDRPLAPLLLAAAERRLAAFAPASTDTPNPPACAVGVVLAAAGYPGAIETGRPIAGLDHLSHEYPDVLPFFAGVTAVGPNLVTSGGRVMTLVARGASYQAAIDRVYDAASRVHFEGMQFRRDIGRKALTRATPAAP